MEVIFSAKGGHVSGVKQTQSRPKNGRFQPFSITYTLQPRLFFKRLRRSMPIIFILTISTAILWVNYATEDGRDEKLLAIIGNRVIDKAKDLGLHKSAAFQATIKQKMHEYLLMKNASFEKLAKAHSVRRWSAENAGDIGSFTYQELGRYADRIFPIEVGRWVGPIKMDTQYAFFKCAVKDSERARTFDEARAEIEKISKPIWQKKTRQDLLEHIRQHVKVVTYMEGLKSIQLN